MLGMKMWRIVIIVEHFDHYAEKYRDRRHIGSPKYRSQLRYYVTRPPNGKKIRLVQFGTIPILELFAVFAASKRVNKSTV